jgi:REP element-mobilizing transposase RayT
MDPRSTDFYRMRLPHWEVDSATYFITIRRHGALPKDVTIRLRDLAAAVKGARSEADKLSLERKLFRDLEHWLDHTPVVRDLAGPDMARAIMDSIYTYESLGRWRVYAFVVMPSHLHLLVQIQTGNLATMMRDFKHWTGRAGNQILGQKGVRFWQREWFDHWPRSGDELERIFVYIHENPVNAGLVQRVEDWPFGSWSNNQDGAQ